MAELVKERLDVSVSKERRPVSGGRREIADQGDGGTLVFAAGQQLAFDDAELGEVIVFAFAREHVEIEQAQRFARFQV